MTTFLIIYISIACFILAGTCYQILTDPDREPPAFSFALFLLMVLISATWPISFIGLTIYTRAKQ